MIKLGSSHEKQSRTNWKARNRMQSKLTTISLKRLASLGGREAPIAAGRSVERERESIGK